MKQRIALWGLAGFVVASGWVLFFLTTSPWPRWHPLWIIVDITAPASFLRVYPLKYYWFILINAAAYALLGMVFELLRRTRVRHAAN